MTRNAPPRQTENQKLEVMNAEDVITKLEMQKHPEGGWFSESYRDEEELKFDEEKYPGGSRSVCTIIHFLLQPGQVSHLHKLASNEAWYFHAGNPLVVVELDESTGELKETILGADLLNDQQCQHVVPRGVWFGARPLDESVDHQSFDFSLVGCSVAPGFDFQDFELGTTTQLVSLFPQHKELVTLMSPKEGNE
eukprot:TRINITY_DN14108_c0_g2_i1.p1 TRINITY_DN14108_c0_g2~~TRINITY_DN14108_c0_g2_i1.p1  ORF type:complete len:194 (+),score=39.84 TRINITY_DN14108_c0_g2_i1:165-746(+)